MLWTPKTTVANLRVQTSDLSKFFLCHPYLLSLHIISTEGPCNIQRGETEDFGRLSPRPHELSHILPPSAFLKDQMDPRIEATCHILLESQYGIWTINPFGVIWSLGSCTPQCRSRNCKVLQADPSRPPSQGRASCRPRLHAEQPDIPP